MRVRIRTKPPIRNFNKVYVINKQSIHFKLKLFVSSQSYDVEKRAFNEYNTKPSLQLKEKYDELKKYCYTCVSRLN